MALTTDIKSLLPHREPFLFVDAIISADDKGCVCEHTFTENEFFFKGHFPEYPVVPGVILCETMAQAGGAALRYSGVVSDEEYLLEEKKTTLNDRIMGILKDPFTFIEEITKDREAYASPDKYRVFCMEMTVDEFEKESNSFVAIPEKWDYNDGLEMCVGYNRFEYTDAFKKFIIDYMKNKMFDQCIIEKSGKTE